MERTLDDEGGAASDASAADSGDEQHVMDPSDPRAHGRDKLDARAKIGGVSRPPASRWDSDGDDGEVEEEEDEDLGVRMEMDESDCEKKKKKVEINQKETTEKLKARLSSWAAARFLVPRSERPLPMLEEPPLEPLNDFILSDFGSRFRGTRGDVEVQKAIEDEAGVTDSDSDADKFQVGAPLYSTGSTDGNDAIKSNKDDKKKDVAKDKDGAARKRRPESRYFIKDLATKCFNCGQVGHMSAVCANDRLQKPCYYCALRGHSTFACPHLPCSACLQLGHEPRDCPNKRLSKNRSCTLCGRSGHDKKNCNTDSYMPVTCMVCLEVGHLHCTPIPPPADRRMYCPYCAENHTLARCRDYVEPAPMSFMARLPRSDMKCFMCNTAGHLAAECPKRTGHSGGSGCFNCGERGHYANDCPRRNISGSRGRKRGRNEYYADDYDEDEDDSSYGRRGGGGRNQSQRSHTRYAETYDDASEEDQHYYVPGGGNRGGNRKKPRLDQALPSYRQNNTSSGNGGGGGGGGYKGDRRRWK